MPRSAKTTQYDPRILLTHRILVFSNTLGKGAVRLYAGEFGVPLAEWRLLSALMTGEEYTVNRLAAALGTDKGWISRTASALVRKRLAKTNPDRNDARSFYLGVTAAGRSLYERILPAAIARHRKLVSVLTAEELATFEQLLARLQQQADLIAEGPADGIGAADPKPPRSSAGSKAASRKAVPRTRRSRPQTTPNGN